MADILSDDLLKQIAEGSGRCYGHEGRAMAAELLARRRAEKEAAAKVAQQSAGSGVTTGQPFPHGLYP